jgi:hypothetical protein
MRCDVECLAVVLLLLAGSDHLASFVQEPGFAKIRCSDQESRMSWFRDKRGIVRWGVELVEAVEWKIWDMSLRVNWRTTFWRLLGGFALS